MTRYRGRHRAPTNTGRLLARTAIAGAAIGAPLAAAPAAHAESGGTVWDRLAQCESSGNWSINTGNGFSGGLQFTPQTWHAFGGEGRAHDASREEQIVVAERVLAQQGWNAWPACSRKLGLRGTPPKFHAAPQATPSTTPRTATSSGGGQTVEVRSGDTLAEIAATHGVDGGWQELAELNGLADPHALRVGTVLKLN